jgi:hypothetical protein
MLVIARLPIVVLQVAHRDRVSMRSRSTPNNTTMSLHRRH